MRWGSKNSPCVVRDAIDESFDRAERRQRDAEDAGRRPASIPGSGQALPGSGESLPGSGQALPGSGESLPAPPPSPGASQESQEGLEDTIAERQREDEASALEIRINHIVRLASAAREISFAPVLFRILSAQSLTFRHAPTFAEIDAAQDAIDQAAPINGCMPSRFYVGATQNPHRRWVGDPQDGMAGHANASLDGGGRWRQMIVIAARVGPAGAALEASLIAHYRAEYPWACANRAEDARGLAAHEYALNFVYVLVS